MLIGFIFHTPELRMNRMLKAARRAGTAEVAYVKKCLP